jgi:DNA-binding NtrC family response regulator
MGHREGNVADARLVLVAIRDEVLCRPIAEALRVGGYLVETVEKGEEVLDAISRARPSLLLHDLDVELGEWPGLLRAIRHAHPHLPVAIATSPLHRDWRHEIDPTRLGVDGVLFTPFGLRDLLDLVRRLCPQA